MDARVESFRILFFQLAKAGFDLSILLFKALQFHLASSPFCLRGYFAIVELASFSDAQYRFSKDDFFVEIPVTQKMRSKVHLLR
jgi:hypothetical protein